MRKEPDNVGHQQNRAGSISELRNGAMHSCIRFDEIRPVAANPFKTLETFRHFENRSARRLLCHGHGNRILVILDKKQYRKSFACRPVHGFKEFTFTGGPFSTRNVHHLVGFFFLDRQRKPGRLQILRSCRTGLCDDAGFFFSPVRGHLSSAGPGTLGAMKGLQKNFFGRHPKRETKCEIAVIRHGPVVPRLQVHCRGNLGGLMSDSGNVEKRFALFEKDQMFFVELACRQHKPVGPHEFLLGEDSFLPFLDGNI